MHRKRGIQKTTPVIKKRNDQNILTLFLVLILDSCSSKGQSLLFSIREAAKKSGPTALTPPPHIEISGQCHRKIVKVKYVLLSIWEQKYFMFWSYLKWF